MSDPYRTLAEEARHEIDKIKGSRFIGTAGPFEGEVSLRERIEALRAEFPAANHHCWAWRRGDTFRYGDDGEPSGTAGKPMLQRIDGLDLDRVQVVVTRIFGGSKLGTGGLIRAYSAAAGEVLAQAKIVEVVPSAVVAVTVPYELDGAVRALGVELELAVVGSEFGETVIHRFRVPLTRVDAFNAEIRERTAGRARVETGDES